MNKIFMTPDLPSNITLDTSYADDDILYTGTTISFNCSADSFPTWNIVPDFDVTGATYAYSVSGKKKFYLKHQ